MGMLAFSECTSLTSVDIPEGVASIGYHGFQGCTSLVSISIPSSVTSIEPYAFIDCSSLSLIKVDEKNTVYDSRNNCNAIIETATNTLTLGCANTTIPNDVATIKDYAFSGVPELTSINFPSGVAKIGMGAFRNCTKLSSVYFANSAIEIGSYAFFNCTGLKSVDCNWTDLSNVNVLEGAFYMITSGATLYVPAGTKEMYENTSPWSSFKDIIEKEESSIDNVGNRNILISKQDGSIVVSGLNGNELVEVYNVAGAKLGQAVAVAGTVSIAVSANHTVVIVKIGGTSMKIAL